MQSTRGRRRDMLVVGNRLPQRWRLREKMRKISLDNTVVMLECDEEVLRSE